MRWNECLPLLQSWGKIYAHTGNLRSRYLTNAEVKEFVNAHKTLEKDGEPDSLHDPSLVKFVRQYIGL
jgi:hypothetical protein